MSSGGGGHPAIAALRATATEVAADGTDPDHLAVVVAWLSGSGRSAEALRRRVCDHDAGAEQLGSVATPAGEGQPRPSAILAGLAGEPAPSEAEDVERLLQAWRDVGARVAMVGDAGYPDRLGQGWPGTDAPPWLAIRGEPADQRRAAALVGARRASSYGTGVAAWLAEAAAAAGVRIVSGGAVGVDNAAHEAALDLAGGTTVVLGCGHAVAYPRPHARRGGLFDRVLAGGGAIVSESLPHDPPRAHRIRARNRIVAALSDAVVVIEGSGTSGALLTASAGLDRDRPVLAVPGDVRAPGSAAPHRLLAEGAAPCTSPRDLLEVVGGEVRRGTPAPVVSALPEPVLRELAERWPRAIRLEDLAARTGQPVGALLASMTRAKVAGEVAEGPDGVRLRRAPARSGDATDEGARDPEARDVT